MDTSCTNIKQLLIYYQLRITISKVRNLTDTGEVIFMPENRAYTAAWGEPPEQPQTQSPDLHSRVGNSGSVNLRQMNRQASERVLPT